MKTYLMAVATIGTLSIFTNSSQAASVTYQLTEAANTQWPDGPTYVSVLVDDDKSGVAATDLYFKVTATNPFTLSKFGFNLNLAADAKVTISMIPAMGTGWSQSNGSGYGFFGQAEYEVVGNGNDPASIFEFTVHADQMSNNGKNDLGDYNLLISMFENNNQGHFMMANVVCPDGQSTVNGGLCGNLGSNARNANTDVTIGEQVASVPVPAAAWLFGSALLGFVSIGARRKV